MLKRIIMLMLQTPTVRFSRGMGKCIEVKKGVVNIKNLQKKFSTEKFPIALFAETMDCFLYCMANTP
jgi:hypothetical protein